MIRRILTRSIPLTGASVVLLILVGVALAGNLPFAVQQAVSETASELGIDVPAPSTTDPTRFRTSDSPPSATAIDRAVNVRKAIDRYRTAMTAWRTCIAQAVPRAKGGPVDECGPKPHLDVPRPADDSVVRGEGIDQERGRPEGAGPPESNERNRSGNRDRSNSPPGDTGKSGRP